MLFTVTGTANTGFRRVYNINDILTAVEDAAPLLSKVTVVYSAAQIKYYIEGTVADAADHTENAAITAAADTLTAVTLTPAEIVKLIQVSEAAKMMSVGADGSGELAVL